METQENISTQAIEPTQPSAQDIELTLPEIDPTTDPVIIKAAAVFNALKAEWQAAIEKVEAEQPEIPKIPADVPQFVTEYDPWAQ